MSVILNPRASAMTQRLVFVNTPQSTVLQYFTKRGKAEKTIAGKTNLDVGYTRKKTRSSNSGRVVLTWGMCVRGGGELPYKKEQGC